MSEQGSLMADEDEEFMREAIYIMIAWTIIVVAAGIALVLFQDSFAGVFALSGV